MSFSDDEINAAVEALNAPGRLAEAQDVVSRAIPRLQEILGSALTEGGWFDTAHEAAVKEAVGSDDLTERTTAVRTLFAEETRLTMLVGVAVGFELAKELGPASTAADDGPAAADRKE